MNGFLTSAQHFLHTLNLDAGTSAILILTIRLVGTAFAAYLLYVLYEVVLIGRNRHPRIIGAVFGLADFLLGLTLRTVIGNRAADVRRQAHTAKAAPVQAAPVTRD
ncbi:protein of unknown function [Rhodovastum atsumiense]|nr:protein of unknown function [Rhodovastum atsumiense]